MKEKYYHKESILVRGNEKLLIMQQYALWDLPIQFTHYAILPTSENQDRKWIFDPDDIRTIHVREYHYPDDPNDEDMVLLTGHIYYKRGLSTPFYNVRCGYRIEKKELKPARKWYEWRNGQWYSTKTNKYVSAF